MNLSFSLKTFYGIAKEALPWAPIAIGLATNDPTILTISELGYAAFHLHKAYKAESTLDKFGALSNAAITLISPFTYHPYLASHISTANRAHLLLVVGSNNVVRGTSEIASITTNIAVDAFSKILEAENHENKSFLSKAAAYTLRLGLGISRLYAGSNQINMGLSYFSGPSPEILINDSQESPVIDSEETPLNESHESSKIDPKYAREEFHRPAKPQGSANDAPPKMSAKHAKETFHSPKKFSKTSLKADCFPKSGTHHQYDTAFYKKGADSIKAHPISSEKRCAGTLYLRSEDTNYLHSKDGYLRAEDTRPIGELKQKVIDDLIQDGRVWFRTMEKVRNICEEIDKTRQSGGKIERLILVGHGNSHEMLLSQKDSNPEDIMARFFSSSFDPFKTFEPPSRPNQPSFPSTFLKEFQENDPFKRFQENNHFENFFKPFPSFDHSDSFKQIFDPPTVPVERGMDGYALNTGVIFPKKGCLKNLEPDADIILIGCSTGQKTKGGNLADAIARQAPGHKVFAPETSLSMSDVRADIKAEKLKFSFKKPPLGIDITYTAYEKKGSKNKT